MPSSGLWWHQTCKWCTNMCTWSTMSVLTQKQKILLTFKSFFILIKWNHTSWSLHKCTTSHTWNFVTLFLEHYSFAVRAEYTILHSYSFLTRWPCPFRSFRATHLQRKLPFLFYLYISRVSQCVEGKFMYVHIPGPSFNGVPRLSKLEHNWYTYIIMNADLTCCL